MKYSLRRYAEANRVSIRQIFYKAWRDTYKQMPDFPLITEDIDRYLNFGAMPPYVINFLKKQHIPKISYFPWWAKIEV